MSKAMERMQQLEDMADISKRFLAMVMDEKKRLEIDLKREKNNVYSSSENDDTDTDPDAEYGTSKPASKTAVQILEERKAQDVVTMEKPKYHQFEEHGAWFCKLSVQKKQFKCSAETKKDAYQLCAAAALEHFQLL